MNLQDQLKAMGHSDLLDIIKSVDPEHHELLTNPSKVDDILDAFDWEDEEEES